MKNEPAHKIIPYHHGVHLFQKLRKYVKGPDETEVWFHRVINKCLQCY